MSYTHYWVMSVDADGNSARMFATAIHEDGRDMVISVKFSNREEPPVVYAKELTIPYGKFAVVIFNIAGNATDIVAMTEDEFRARFRFSADTLPTLEEMQ